MDLRCCPFVVEMWCGFFDINSISCIFYIHVHWTFAPNALPVDVKKNVNYISSTDNLCSLPFWTSWVPPVFVGYALFMYFNMFLVLHMYVSCYTCVCVMFNMCKCMCHVSRLPCLSTFPFCLGPSVFFRFLFIYITFKWEYHELKSKWNRCFYYLKKAFLRLLSKTDRVRLPTVEPLRVNKKKKQLELFENWQNWIIFSF